MFFDDIAKKSNCFLDVGIIEFLELFDEDIKHRNSNFGLFGIVGVDVLGCFFCFFFLGIIVEKRDFFLDNIFNKNE